MKKVSILTQYKPDKELHCGVRTTNHTGGITKSGALCEIRVTHDDIITQYDDDGIVTYAQLVRLKTMVDKSKPFLKEWLEQRKKVDSVSNGRAALVKKIQDAQAKLQVFDAEATRTRQRLHDLRFSKGHLFYNQSKDSWLNVHGHVICFSDQISVDGEPILSIGCKRIHLSEFNELFKMATAARKKHLKK